MELAGPIGLNLLAVLALMTAVWLTTLKSNDVSIVDVFWGPGFVAVAWLSLAQAGHVVIRDAVLALLVSVWGLRLAGYLFVRWRGHDGEDRRYANMRAASKTDFRRRSLYIVFWLQAVLLWIISLPVQVAILRGTADNISPLDIAGIVLFFAGFTIEAAADLQLARFKRNPDNKGKILMTGLWSWSRHPNYFGEALLWWGLFLIAVNVAGVIYTIFAPALMTFLLLRVSGVTMLDDVLRQSKPGYDSYIASTSSFIPWPPKRR